MADDIDLVLVGYRPGALHAASRLGLRVLLVEETPPSEAARRRIASSVQTPLEGNEATLVRRTKEALGYCVPRAVVAAGERGVLAAASIRASYGLGGIGPATAHRARDKPTMKTVARAAGIPCTDWRELHAFTAASDLVAELDLPVILKRRDASGTRGLIVARTPDEVARDLASIPEEERDGWMAERFVRGVEMSVESFVFEGEILFVNPTEYLVPAYANIAPASLPAAEAEAVYALNAAVLAALGLRRGMTHLELFRTPQGPVFGEVALRPPGGRIMRLLRRAYDFDPWETVIQLELGDRADLHPTRGRPDRRRLDAPPRRGHGALRARLRGRQPGARRPQARLPTPPRRPRPGARHHRERRGLGGGLGQGPRRGRGAHATRARPASASRWSRPAGSRPRPRERAMADAALAVDFADEPTLFPRVLELLGVVFGFVPEQVRAAEAIGLRWPEVSRPFAVTLGDAAGPVASHVGVLELPLIVQGRRVLAAGIHAVATHPEHRGQGLYRRAMEAALAYVDARFEVAILSTSEPAIYAPFGFREVAEQRFVGPAPTRDRPGAARPLDYSAREDVLRLHDLLAGREPVSRRFGLVGESAVFCFNQAKDPPRYAPSLDALLVCEIEAGTLRLYDVVAPRMPTLEQIVEVLPEPVEQVEVYFEPAVLQADLRPEPHVLDGDDRLCVRGPLACEGTPFLWPRPTRC